MLFVLSFAMNFAAELFSSVRDCEFTPTITILVLIILNRTFLLCLPKSEEIKIYKQLGILTEKVKVFLLFNLKLFWGAFKAKGKTKTFPKLYPSYWSLSLYSKSSRVILVSSGPERFHVDILSVFTGQTKSSECEEMQKLLLRSCNVLCNISLWTTWLDDIWQHFINRLFERGIK